MTEIYKSTVKSFAPACECEIIAKIDAIGAVARARMQQCDPITNAARGGAEVDYMTPAELQQLHNLKMALPTFSEARVAALGRIKARIAERRAAQPVEGGEA